MSPASIIDVVETIRDMKAAGIIKSFAIGGAFAAILHNEPVSTVDLDIFFLLSKEESSPILSLSEIYDYARANGFTFDHEFINIYGWLVQFVEASRNGLWREAISSAESITISGAEVPVIRREYLVAMWLFSGRAKDFQKIALFKESGTLDSAVLFTILDKYDLRVKWEKEKWRFEDEE